MQLASRACTRTPTLLVSASADSDNAAAINDNAPRATYKSDGARRQSLGNAKTIQIPYICDNRGALIFSLPLLVDIAVCAGPADTPLR